MIFYKIKYILLIGYFFLFTGCSMFDVSFPASHDHSMLPKERYEYIAVFGDMQYLMDSDNKAVVYKNSIDWITEQSDSGVVFKCILHTGDITNNNLESQYKRYYNATKEIAEKIPFYSAIGDHDYKWDGYIINSRDSTYFSKYNNFELCNSRLVAEYEPRRKENVVYSNYIHGHKINILCLEFGPRAEVVDWANDVIKNHPNEGFIVLTHEYLEAGGNLRTDNLKSKNRLRNTTFSTPEQIWNNLIKDNDNIICVICGHVGGLYAITYTENNSGRLIAQIQHNTQGEEYRYANWLMVLEFSSESDLATAFIINALTGKYYNDNSSLFTFQYLQTNNPFTKHFYTSNVMDFSREGNEGEGRKINVIK